jgi:hypothetical protein
MTGRSAPYGTWRGKGLLRWRNAAAIFAGGVFLAYIFYLIILNYRVATDLQRNLLRQFHRENETQALTIEFLFAEAVGHARNLANAREIEVYFKNLDLGMSMEYGLRQSIVPIRERFSALAAREFSGGRRMFARILLLDRGGRPLADSGGPDLPWKAYLDPHVSEPSVVVSPDGKDVHVSCPYLFKGRYEGQLLLWLTPESLRLPFVKIDGRKDNEGRWLVSPGPSPVFTPLGAPDHRGKRG